MCNRHPPKINRKINKSIMTSIKIIAVFCCFLLLAQTSFAQDDNEGSSPELSNAPEDQDGEWGSLPEGVQAGDISEDNTNTIQMQCNGNEALKLVSGSDGQSAKCGQTKICDHVVPCTYSENKEACFGRNEFIAGGTYRISDGSIEVKCCNLGPMPAEFYTWQCVQSSVNDRAPLRQGDGSIAATDSDPFIKAAVKQGEDSHQVTVCKPVCRSSTTAPTTAITPSGGGGASSGAGSEAASSATGASGPSGSHDETSGSNSASNSGEMTPNSETAPDSEKSSPSSDSSEASSVANSDSSEGAVSTGGESQESSSGSDSEPGNAPTDQDGDDPNSPSGPPSGTTGGGSGGVGFGEINMQCDNNDLIRIVGEETDDFFNAKCGYTKICNKDVTCRYTDAKQGCFLHNEFMAGGKYRFSDRSIVVKCCAFDQMPAEFYTWGCSTRQMHSDGQDLAGKVKNVAAEGLFITEQTGFLKSVVDLGNSFQATVCKPQCRSTTTTQTTTVTPSANPNSGDASAAAAAAGSAGAAGAAGSPTGTSGSGTGSTGSGTGSSGSGSGAEGGTSGTGSSGTGSGSNGSGSSGSGSASTGTASGSSGSGSGSSDSGTGASASGSSGSGSSGSGSSSSTGGANSGNAGSFDQKLNNAAGNSQQSSGGSQSGQSQSSSGNSQSSSSTSQSSSSNSQSSSSTSQSSSSNSQSSSSNSQKSSSSSQSSNSGSQNKGQSKNPSSAQKSDDKHNSKEQSGQKHSGEKSGEQNHKSGEKHQGEDGNTEHHGSGEHGWIDHRLPLADLEKYYHPAGGSGGSCFSGDTMVATRNGAMRMDSLSIGDEVLVTSEPSSSTSDVAVYSKVRWFIHRDSNAVERFVVLSTADNSTTLSLTPDHLIPIVPCQEMIPVTDPRFALLRSKPARSTRVGDCLLRMVDNGKQQTLEQVQIVSVNHTTRQGIYAPITKSGNIVVNGIIASCYSGFESHRLQHAVFGFLLDALDLFSSLRLWTAEAANAVLANPSGELPTVVELLLQASSALLQKL